MGACYSKTGHDVSPDKEKRPRERKKSSNRNGSLQTNGLVIEIPIQKDLSDTVYTEDSHIITTDMSKCINKSMQTSLDHLSKDENKNIESISGCELKPQNDNDLIQDRTEDLRIVVTDIEQTEKDSVMLLKHLESRVGKVSTSDSGIEDEAAFKGCENVKHYANDKYSESFESHLDSIETHSIVPNFDKHKSKWETNKTCCSLTCDSQRTKPDTDNSSSCQGECQCHLFSQKSRPFHVNKSSESLILKSSMKRGYGKSRQKRGLSWKSADSLDWVESKAVDLDRTKSVCSSILGDDISLLNAPLAAFDSVDFALGSSYDFSKCCGGNMQSKVDYSSDTFQFQFDFSGLENRQSVSSVDRLSESNKTSESSTDLDRICLAISQSSLGTPAEQRLLLEGGDLGDLASSLQQQEVSTMKINGREVVVMDAEIFSKIIDVIHNLKMKLSQLQDLMQDEEQEEDDEGRRTSVSLLSSSLS